MSVFLGLASALGGMGRGMVERREQDRIREERARLQAAAELKDKIAQQRQAQQDGIAAEGRMNAARAEGFRPVEETRQLGQALEGAGAVMPGLRGYGRAMQQGARRPDATVNGVGMVRAAESDAGRVARLERQEAQGTLMQQTAQQQALLEQMRAQLPASVRPLAVDMATAKALLGKVAEQRMAPARAESPVNMQVIQTADGPMAFNPRTGQAQPITAGGQRVGAPQQVGGKMTDGQRRISGLVDIAEAERKKMDNLGTPSGMDRFLSKVPFGIGEPLMSDKGQQYLSAAEAFARPYLYAMSGQNATDDEVRSTARQSIPGIFTRAATDADMRERRARMVGGMRTIAGQPAGESEAAANFRRNARAEGYTDAEIDAEMQRRGMR